MTGWLSVLLACTGPEPAPGPDPCTSLTWQTAGKPVLDTWCTACHSQHVAGEDRSGAPSGVDFDTWEGASMWADRIGVRTIGEAATMPPAGGVPDADRARLADWLACGAPGEPEESTVPCAEPIVVEGDLVVDTDADLDCVVEVTGALRITGDATWVLLPELTSAASVSVVDNPGLTQLELPELATTGDLQVEANPRLEGLVLDRLATIGGDLVLRDSPVLTTVRGTDSILGIGGDLALEGLTALPAVDGFSELVELGGDLRVVDTGVTTLHGFHRLTDIPGDLVVQDNDLLVAARGVPELLHVGGSLVLAGTALPTWEGLDFLVAVDGDLRIDDNPDLTELPSLQRLEAVGADLTIQDNPMLPTTEADDLAARVAVGGSITITGNAP